MRLIIPRWIFFIGAAIVIAFVLLYYIVGIPYLPTGPTYRLENVKVMIVLFENYQPRELHPVLKALDREGATIYILAVNKSVGASIEYHMYIMDIVDKFELYADTCDAIVIIGGKGVYDRVVGIIEDPGVELVGRLCSKFREKGKLVAAICAAPAILAKAGILKGVRATCFPSSELVEILRAHGAIYVDMNADVVIDDGIMTAVGPDVADKFAEAIVEYLVEQKTKTG
ncbi:MAG: hypothetical protein DRN15_04290 [Thermoprotei archaeon]|nr:MAG: hypothetical protein DRM97_04840 [Thermoprotei archaeon]RLF24121.1 MAG: hypothetical protein DRN15_04290 [Thermoprotei archaeon]